MQFVHFFRRFAVGIQSSHVSDACPVFAAQSKIAPEVRYVTQLIQNITNVCPSGPPLECQCDNDPEVTVKGPFGFGPIGFLKVLGCAPSESHEIWKMRLFNQIDSAESA